MGQFKPMVKMMTTEPSIELKLKKGGHVAMPKMKSKDHGTGSKKMADGGMPGVLARAGLPPGPVGGAAPAMPSLATRRKAMKMRRPMKEGGESAAEHASEMKKMASTAKELKKHESMPASKAHKGLKTGGGVDMGQGGYKDGGSVIPVSASKRGAEKYDETLMHTAKPDHSPAKTGGVKNGNGGGYKKGGKVKMAMGGITPRPRDIGVGTRPPSASMPFTPNRPKEPTGPGRTPSGAPIGAPIKGGAVRYAKGGGVEGNVSTTPSGVTNTTTGGVRKGNGGGFKKGGEIGRAHV